MSAISAERDGIDSRHRIGRKFFLLREVKNFRGFGVTDKKCEARGAAAK